jgi:hypothetical protein
VKAILAGARPIPPAATLRSLRAIQVLERIGTPEARGVLRNLASGAAVSLKNAIRAVSQTIDCKSPGGFRSKTSVRSNQRRR